MKTYNIAILGATGAVGREMMKVLEERSFPMGEFRPLASARSAGKSMSFMGRDYIIQEANENAFDGMDIVLGAAENDVAEALAPAIVRAGAVFIDNSSAFRLNDDVPLIVPEINPEDIAWHKGIISNPNCSTIIALMAAYPLHRLSPVESIVASTYQAVSGAGIQGVWELEAQTRALAEGKEIVNETFDYQIVQNLIPQIGGFKDNGYTSEEMKMQNEGRKIMHRPELAVSCTCVRVPVMRSHSISMVVRTKDRLSVSAAQAAIGNMKGCLLVDDPANKKYPMPLDSSDQDLVFVGRVRRDLIDEHGINLWCCGDQVRKGAATNAVQIAELFVRD